MHERLYLVCDSNPRTRMTSGWIGTLSDLDMIRKDFINRHMIADFYKKNPAGVKVEDEFSDPDDLRKINFLITHRNCETVRLFDEYGYMYPLTMPDSEKLDKNHVVSPYEFRSQMFVQHIGLTDEQVTEKVRENLRQYGDRPSTKPRSEWWEYMKFAQSNDDTAIKTLNDLGVLGWELLGLDEDNKMPIYWLKRKKQ